MIQDVYTHGSTWVLATIRSPLDFLMEPSGIGVENNEHLLPARSAKRLDFDEKEK
jgi:hypothetical protein